MNILAVESSCDETAVAIVRDGREVLCDCIASQVALHRESGGVVPEIASRKHIEAIYGLADQDTRMIVKGFVYDVLLIDNPDEMNEQLEIYLRKVGAWNGGW